MIPEHSELMLQRHHARILIIQWTAFEEKGINEDGSSIVVIGESYTASLGSRYE